MLNQGASNHHAIKRLWIVLIAILLVAGISGASYQEWLPLLYRWLIVTQPPVPAQAILVLGGGITRAERAAQIFSTVQPEMIIVSGVTPGIATDTHVMVDAGVPRAVIHPVAEEISTYEEAEQIIPYLRDNGVTSALIVTDPFHSKRALATFTCMNHFMGTNIRFYVTDARVTKPFDTFWTTPYTTQVILSEWLKIGYYTLRYGITCY